SALQATLTLPGIAGIVLTVGMAVDANILIYERIREELRNGTSPSAAIQGGFQHALSAIVDANLTTLIAAVMLFAFGTGPIRGFAVVLFLGILTSLFTALMGGRALVHLAYGRRRRIEQLAI
ncbi:MAG: MMPL family transporter, partial [Steroidobacteraceae bacterium]